MPGRVARASAVAALALALALGLQEAYLQWEVRAAAALAPALRPLDAVREADLTREAFYRDYVLKRRPVKIRLERPDEWNSTRLLEQCGGSKSDHISDGSYSALLSVLRPLGQGDFWLILAFEWVLMPLVGRWTTLRGELALRTRVPLREYLAYAAAADSGGPRDFALPLPLTLRRALPAKLLLMLDFFARPRYLHDAPLEEVCPQALDWLHVPGLLLPNWLWAGSPASRDDREFQREPTCFIGRAQTMNPLHQNIRSDLDFALIALQGKKRFTIFDANQRDRLRPFEIRRNIWLYLVDPFLPDLVAAPGYQHAEGWAGELEAGELLYAPGDTIHAFENYDFERPTVAVKLWYRRHTAACGAGGEEAQCAEAYGLSTSRENDAAAPTLREYKARGARR